MGSKIAFWPMSPTCFALHMDCCVAFNKIHSCDWSVLLTLQGTTNGNQNAPETEILGIS